MKKTGWILLAAALMLIMLSSPAGASAEETREPDEWTVMFYFCGSDLESKYEYATDNLIEIFTVDYPFGFSWDDVDSPENADEEFEVILDIPKVNIVIETGGCTEWHAQELNMDIATDALQRWYYRYYPTDLPREFVESHLQSNVYPFELKETLPLRSMADPNTLADFIRWSAENYPAKKYALVLWDHGGGSGSGLFIDELFKGDVMYLDELKQALKGGSVQLETLVIDACLMANIETAWAVKDSARWMVASEENVPGKGTAISDWLSALVNCPQLGGEWLGRCICDMTAIKYADLEEERDKSLLTWSVIDLSKIDPLVASFEQFFSMMGDSLRSNVKLISQYTRQIYETEQYGDGQQNMRDFGSIIYDERMNNITNPEQLGNMMSALQEAVVYIVRGPGRSEARGLTFCYPAGFTNEEMDHYAKNFPLPAYLAFLDAISGWSAPDEVYEQVEKLPHIDTIEQMQVTITRTLATSNGLPGIKVPDSAIFSLSDGYYTLYQLNAETGEIIRLGKTSCGYDMADEDGLIFRANDPMHWPAVDGTLCCIDMVQNDYITRVYNIPVQINTENAILRCGRTISKDGTDGDLNSAYEIYGVWEGYDESSKMPNRNVTPLAMLAGQEYRLLYPVAGADGTTVSYMASESKKMYRALDVQEITLPAGTYYLEYELDDLFLRKCRMERIEIHWDGENMTFPEDFAWEGSFPAKWQ